MKKWHWMALAAVLLAAPGGWPVLAGEGETAEPAGKKPVTDITEEVLTGPSDLNPEKILGPGGVSIATNKGVLMSFGATVRFIPASESSWDFGVSDTVEGFFHTEPLKAYAGSALDTAAGVQQVYEAGQALDRSIAGGASNTVVMTEFNALTAACDEARSAAAGSAVLSGSVNALADRLGDISGASVSIGVPVANGAAAAAARAVAAAAAPEVVASAASQAADAIVTVLSSAAAADPVRQAAIQALGGAAAKAAAPAAAEAALASAGAGILAQSNAEAAAVGAAEAAIVRAAVSTPGAQPGGANLLQTTERLAAAVAQIVTSDPAATASDMTGAVAYLTILKARADSFSPYYLADSFLKSHQNESGVVNDGYFRNETKMYFNAMPQDKKWSFYAALEFDRPLDNSTVDNRGGRDEASSNFGLERLNASVKLVDGLRLHGGWDVWGIDIIEAGSIVYGDDNPGFWIKGDYDKFDFSAAWLKLEENDFQIKFNDHSNAADTDRDLLAGYADYHVNENNRLRFFYAWDRIRSVPSLDLLGAMAAEAGLKGYAGIYGNNAVPGGGATWPDTNAHTIGTYWLGNMGRFEFMLEGAYKFGTANDTGLRGVSNNAGGVIQYDDFDISAYAFSGDVGIELKDMVGWESFRPRLGFIYTSGDDDPDDDTLGGYSGVTNAQRFSRMWGGENTIIGDGNFLLGSALYGYVPELHGNGTPVFVGGLQNSAGTGTGRGDNPGMTMISAGLTLRPRIFLIYRTNANFFYWNEDIYAANLVTPLGVDHTGLTQTSYTLVKGGYVGCEWDNELTLALAANMFIKGQASFFFPGGVIKDLTSAVTGGQESSDIAIRLAMELIWNF